MDTGKGIAQTPSQAEKFFIFYVVTNHYRKKED